MEWLRLKWKFDKCLIVEGYGRGGGLALLWMDEALVKVKSYSKSHIDVVIGHDEEDRRWKFTSFYGDPKMSKRQRSRELLRNIKSSSTLPWLCGDFNEILNNDEKLGGASRPAKQMENFREALVDCELNEVQFTRGQFTWSRGKCHNAVYERLDRGLATEGWLNLFSFSNIR